MEVSSLDKTNKDVLYRYIHLQGSLFVSIIFTITHSINNVPNLECVDTLELSTDTFKQRCVDSDRLSVIIVVLTFNISFR